MAAERKEENVPVIVTADLPDYHLLRPNVVAIPMKLRNPPDAAARQRQLLDTAGPEERPNLSVKARRYLASIGITDMVADSDAATLMWFHALTIGFTPDYLTENSDGVRGNFPRIPLPATAAALRASAKLGEELADLLILERPVQGLTSGAIRPELKSIAVITRAGGGALDPSAGDLDVRAGWGHGGRDGITMPGRGKVHERPYTDAERASLLAAASQRPDTPSFDPLEVLGSSTCDVFLNDVAFWGNVPVAVWDYAIGGYKILKKWLSYREAAVIGRGLSEDEVRTFTAVARRITAILLLGPALRNNYEAIKRHTYPWPRGDDQ